MKTILFTLACTLLFTACSKDSFLIEDDDPISAQHDVSGIFSGKFHREGRDSADVRIHLEEKKFYGQTSTPGYPIICGGRYSYNSSTITFTDTCSIGAPDPSLVLNGVYNYTLEENKYLRIWRTVNNITDQYILSRLFR